MTFPNRVTDFGEELTPYLIGKGRLQCKGQVDSMGRKQLLLKLFGKVLASYTWAEREQAYLRD